VRKLAAVIFVLALLGASTQCIADCFTQQKIPPCHQHSKGKDSAPTPCKNAQSVTDTPAVCPPSAETPAPAGATFDLFALEAQPPNNARWSYSILRL